MFNNVIHKFVITAGLINNETSEYTDLSKNITAIAIKKNYYSFVYPLYVINMVLTENMRKYIIMNDVDINLSIERYTVDDITTSSEDTFSSDPTIDKQLLNLTLTPFDKSKSFANPNTSDVQDEEDSEEVITSQLINYEVSCIPKDSLLLNGTIVNDCYNNANVNEIILNVLSSLYTGSIYLQESFNTNRYDSLLIPPLSLVQALNFLQDEYFVYDNSLNLFFDDNKVFIYDIKSKDRKYENELSVNIITNSETYSADIFQTPQIDENEDIRFYLKNNPLFFSNHDVYKNKIGTQTVFNSYDDNFNLISRDYNNKEISKNKTRYFWNPKRYSYFENSEMNRFYQFCSLKYENIDPTLFNPGTRIYITGSELEEINGQYALLGINIYFSSLDYVTYSNSIILSLGKL